MHISAGFQVIRCPQAKSKVSSRVSDFPGNRILYLSKLFLTCMWTAYRCGEQGLLTDHLGPEKLFFRLRINRDLCFRHDLEYWDNGESKVMSV